VVEPDFRPLAGISPGAATPRISILLPFYNAAETLASCLRSIQRQTETRWECIAVDDGSSDPGPGLVEAARDADPRFVLISRPRAGLVAALNAGLEHCQAEFTARMDADDWMHRDRLAAQLSQLESQPELAGLGTRVRTFPRGAHNPGRQRYEKWLNRLVEPESVARDAFIECPIAHPTLMLRSEILRAFGYRAMGWPEDYDLLLRLLAADHALAVHPRRLLGWRDGPARLSRQALEYTLERFTACKAAHLASGPLAGSERYLLWGYGATGRALRRALLHLGKSPSHIVEVHPRRLGQVIHGAPVVPPESIPELPRHPLLVSVAGPGPRAEIRATLAALALREGIDFYCVA
jgi:hypothetical protein